jgi:hypothetical protein
VGKKRLQIKCYQLLLFTFAAEVVFEAGICNYVAAFKIGFTVFFLHKCKNNYVTCNKKFGHDQGYTQIIGLKIGEIRILNEFSSNPCCLI